MCAAETDELVRQVLRDAVVCPWRCLGLPPSAALEHVRKRYLLLAKRLHPDKVAHEKSKDAFAAVESAFQDCMARIAGRSSVNDE